MSPLLFRNRFFDINYSIQSLSIFYVNRLRRNYIYLKLKVSLASKYFWLFQILPTFTSYQALLCCWINKRRSPIFSIVTVFTENRNFVKEKDQRPKPQKYVFTSFAAKNLTILWRPGTIGMFTYWITKPTDGNCIFYNRVTSLDICILCKGVTWILHETDLQNLSNWQFFVKTT